MEDLIFDKGGKNIKGGKDSLFRKWCRENWTVICKRTKLEHFLTPYTKIKLKMDKGLNVKTIKLLEENIGRTFNDINQSKILYDPSTRVMEIKTKIKDWDLINLKKLLHSKRNYKQGEKTTLRLEKIIEN